MVSLIKLVRHCNIFWPLLNVKWYIVKCEDVVIAILYSFILVGEHLSTGVSVQ